jgi:hypothetical protein
VGVVSDAKDYGVAEEVPHVIFNPFSQLPLAGSVMRHPPTLEPSVSWRFR